MSWTVAKFPTCGRSKQTTAQLYRLVTDISKNSADSHEKVAPVKSLAQSHVELDLLDRLFSNLEFLSL